MPEGHGMKGHSDLNVPWYCVGMEDGMKCG